MNISTVHSVFFSPNGNTKALTEVLASKFNPAGGTSSVSVDLSCLSNRKRPLMYSISDLVILAVPTYAGRIPNKILPDLKENQKGNGTPAIILVTFGNRSPGSALMELGQLASENGFLPLGAAAIACPHAFAKIGVNLPSEQDLTQLKRLADGVYETLQSGETKALDFGAPEDIQPYYRPLKLDGTPASFLKAKPVTDDELCDRCGICIHVCPMGAISAENPIETPGTCIKCQACIHKCPKGAKSFTDEDFLSHRDYLEEHFQTQAESIFMI